MVGCGPRKHWFWVRAPKVINMIMFVHTLNDRLGIRTLGTKKRRSDEGGADWARGLAAVVRLSKSVAEGNEAFRPSGASRRPVEGL